MNYLLLIFLGVCVALHIWMMFRGHKGHKKQTSDEHKGNNHGGCCH